MPLRLKDMTPYNAVTTFHTSALQVPLEDYCNGFTVKNGGTSTLIFQEEQLAPGESVSIGGNYGEIYQGRINIRFTGAGVNLCVVRQKVYLNINDC